MAEKLKQVGHYWATEHKDFRGYGSIDTSELRSFTGVHPVIMTNWLAKEAETEFAQTPGYKVTRRNLRNRLRFWVEAVLKIEISKKHYKSLD